MNGNSEISLRNKMVNVGTSIAKMDGIENVSLRKVANVCGVTHSSPYRHFKNKEDFLNEIVVNISHIFGEFIIKNISFDNSYKEMLVNMGCKFVDFAIKYPKYFDALFLSKYVIQTQPENNEMVSNETIPGFEEFKQVVIGFSKENKITVKNDIEVMQLWSFIMGLSVIIGHHNVGKYDDEWIRLIISNMVVIYIQGGINN